MATSSLDNLLEGMAPLVEQYEFECLLSARNAEQTRGEIASTLTGDKLVRHQSARSCNSHQAKCVTCKNPDAI